MSTFLHRVGVCFGTAEPTAEESASARTPVSWRRQVVAALLVVVLAGLGSALIEGDSWTGIRFGIFMLVVLTAMDFHRRRQDRLGDDARR